MILFTIAFAAVMQSRDSAKAAATRGTIQKCIVACDRYRTVYGTFPSATLLPDGSVSGLKNTLYQHLYRSPVSNGTEIIAEFDDKEIYGDVEASRQVADRWGNPLVYQLLHRVAVRIYSYGANELDDDGRRHGLIPSGSREADDLNSWDGY